MHILKRLGLLVTTYAFGVALMTPIYYVVCWATLAPVSWLTAFHGTLRLTVILMVSSAGLRWLFTGPLKSVANRGSA
jgi:hypothetical protein